MNHKTRKSGSDIENGNFIYFNDIHVNKNYKTLKSLKHIKKCCVKHIKLTLKST